MAEAHPNAGAPRLNEATAWWRKAACISDFGLELGEGWSSEDLRTFVALAHEACARLAARDSIPAEEIISWPVLDDLRIFPRGAKEVATGPVVELGQAVIALVSGQLEQPPPGKAWFYGTPTGRETLGMESGAG